MSRKEFGRQDNTEKMKMMIRDDSNTMQLSPNDSSFNKHIGGGYSFVGMLNQTMLYEQRERLTNKYNARLKAETELQSMPKCFEHCVTDVTTGLNSMEKNCMRECYFKRISVRDDMNIYFQQRAISERVKAMPERGA